MSHDQRTKAESLLVGKLKQYCDCADQSLLNQWHVICSVILTELHLECT